MEEPLLGGELERPVSWKPFAWLYHNKPPQQRRLVDRSANFHQSNGKFFIRKRIKIVDRRTLYAGDWFHSLVNSPTPRLILILLMIYMLITFLFAIPYFLISKCYGCNMGISNFREAFVFSLETIATIGFGTEDIFFGDCILPILVLAAQVCVKLVADALTIGILYSRVARPNTRASTILFANKAVIRKIRGKRYLMFQICELRKHQLVEAHVRLYLIRHNREPEVGGQVSYFQTCTMRLNHPSDELGGMLLLCLPQTVVHEIDLWSPLYPPPVWASKTELHRWTPPAHVSLLDQQPVAPHTPASPTRTGYQSIDGQSHLAGAEVFPSPHRRADVETISPYASQYKASASAGVSRGGDISEKEMMQAYMKDRRIEIVAIVEGTDAATGGSVQARHSYTMDEILWDHSYSRCVFEDPDGTAIIDFSKFHETVEAEEDAAFSGIIPSCV